MTLKDFKEFVDNNNIEIHLNEDAKWCVLLINFSKLNALKTLTGYLNLVEDESIPCRICNGYIGIELLDLVSLIDDEEFPNECEDDSAFFIKWCKENLEV